MSASVPAAIYCRISRAQDGELLGVERQEPPCRQLVERLGWTVSRVYIDNDLSAYHERRRPEYEATLADVRAGRARAVVAWAADRLTRKPRENEDLIDLADRLGVQLATATGEIDLGTPTGRLLFRQLGIIARFESEHRAARIRLKQEQLARAGRVGGGGTRPFGYEQDRMTLVPAEAELIREAAGRLLIGESLRSVAIDWNTRGIRSPKGQEWRTYSLRRLLLRPRIAGLRQHQGVTIGTAAWPPIIDVATHERLRVLLTDPVRQLNGGKLARSYLLTGFLYCGRPECGKKLVARPKDDGRRQYVCASGINFGGCGKIGRLAEPVENLVREELFASLDSRDWDAALQATAHAADESEAKERELLAKLKADDNALKAAEHAHFIERDLDGKPVLSRPHFLRIKQELEASMEETRRAHARLIGNQALASFPRGGEELRKAWKVGSLSWRRAFLMAYIDRVVLLPCVRGLNRFDPTKVSVIWRV
jgi:site-specific DNA recombinase